MLKTAKNPDNLAVYRRQGDQLRMPIPRGGKESVLKIAARRGGGERQMPV